ncbi:sugar transferase [Lachnospiraceae bacterium YSD2013]|nr:sugar transferase [Lachnospiraceae bacterium YSD2013]
MMGGNPFFTQPRPGLDEKIFKLIKFRSMSNKKDERGNLLSDEERLNGYGKFLRSTSLDELPELINILKGDMSFVGPRPQLVRDMVFMSDEIRLRHTAKPGLTGLAQAKGRNAIAWEDKFRWDLQYIDRITFATDCEIVFKTIIDLIKAVLGKGNSQETDITDDYGDYLLKQGVINKDEYDIKQAMAISILKDAGC